MIIPRNYILWKGEFLRMYSVHRLNWHFKLSQPHSQHYFQCSLNMLNVIQLTASGFQHRDEYRAMDSKGLWMMFPAFLFGIFWFINHPSQTQFLLDERLFSVSDVNFYFSKWIFLFEREIKHISEWNENWITIPYDSRKLLSVNNNEYS